MQLNSIHVRMTACFGGLLLVFSLALTLYLDRVASAALSNASGQSLLEVSNSAALVLARTMNEREREIALLSNSYLLTQADIDYAAVQSWLDQIKQSYQFYAWLGLAATDGTVLAASDGLLLQQNVTARPWFQQGRTGSFVGDVHEAVLLSKLLGKPLTDEPLRFIDFSAPVYDNKQQLRAVIASHVHWSWVDDVLKKSLASAYSGRGVQAFILTQTAHWLYPEQYIGSLAVPADLPAPGMFSLVSWQDGGLYLTSRVNVTANTSNELGWQLVLRQPISQALLPLTQLQHQLTLMCVLTMLLGMALAYRLAFQFSRPVAQLVQTAELMNSGPGQAQFHSESSLAEVQQLGDALNQMMATLAEKRQALQSANANLEQQVQQRTADLVQANNTLRAISRQDPLTGIPNRRAADERLQQEFQRLQRTAAGYAVLLLDIDRFKSINDTFGHEVGDQVLQFVALQLQQQLRATDFIGRFGGEEFILLLPITDEQGARQFAEKLCLVLSQSQAPVVGSVTASIGGAMAQLSDPAIETALRAADAAMYQAKQTGRNRVVFAGDAVAITD